MVFVSYFSNFGRSPLNISNILSKRTNTSLFQIDLATFSLLQLCYELTDLIMCLFGIFFVLFCFNSNANNFLTVNKKIRFLWLKSIMGRYSFLRVFLIERNCMYILTTYCQKSNSGKSWSLNIKSPNHAEPLDLCLFWVWTVKNIVILLNRKHRNRRNHWTREENTFTFNSFGINVFEFKFDQIFWILLFFLFSNFTVRLGKLEKICLINFLYHLRFGFHDFETRFLV